MDSATISARFEVSDMSLFQAYTSVIAIPLKVRDCLQTIYLLDLQNRQNIRVLVDMKAHSQAFNGLAETLKLQLGIASDLYPFGLSREMYRDFCITPHSFLYMGVGRLLCGMDLFNRYELIDLNRQTVELLDPGVGGDWLTASPSYDFDGNLHFGSTALSETIQTIRDPDRQSFTRFWMMTTDGKLTETWKGKAGALLHQMKVAGTSHGALGGSLQEPSVVYVSKDGSSPAGHVEGGAYVNFTDMQSGIVYKVGPFDVPAHVEVHPLDRNVVYLSEHNFRLESGRPVILGNASVFKFSLGEGGPAFQGRFTHPELYRMTSHELFQSGESVYMALTGYPDSVFVVNADTLDLVYRLKFRDGERVNLSNGPHACAEPTYGCQISPDGGVLFTIDGTVLRAFDLRTGRLTDEFSYVQKDDPEFVGHAYGFVR